MSDIPSPFLRWEEAMALVNAEEDPIARRMLSRVVGAIGQHHVKQDVIPSEPVDMVFVIRILQVVFREHDRMKAVLEGRWAGEWWDEEDSP